jgi:putative ABC transport system permease protein
MSLPGEWFRRVRYLINRSRLDAALRREMESHRAMMENPQRFGNSLRLREEARDVWGWTWLDDLGRDIRFAARTLRRAPGVTFVAVLSLALATGATTAVFSIVHSVLLRPLPFAEPHGLVQVYGRVWREDRGSVPDPLNGPVGSPLLEAFGKESTTVTALVGYAATASHLDGPQGAERLTAVQADLGLFSLLGVEPFLGRTFRSDDPLEVAVLSFRLWQRRFDGDPTLPGKTILLNGRAFTVLGVMPDAFQFPYRATSLGAEAPSEPRTDVWIPIRPLRASPTDRLRQGRVSVVGRLKPGVALDSASAELDLIAGRVEPHTRGANVRLMPLAEVVMGSVRRALWMLFAAVGLVLAAACANVANLLLARMTVRTREVVTRAALGASSSRLARQFLAESLLISLAGGLLGAFVARWGVDLLVSVGSARIPRAHEIALDWRAFLFLMLVCLATAVLFGLAPALTASRVNVQEITKEAGGHATAAGAFGRLRDSLVIIEVSLAFVLASGAAIVTREVVRLRNVDTGMVTENVLTFHLTPRAPDRDYYAIVERVAQLPGVQSAGFTQLLPLQNWGWEADFEIRGRPRDASQRLVAGLRYVTPGYFRTLGIPVLKGRGFADGDTAEAPRVIVINDALARRYFPGDEPVGRELDRGMIVGVVGNVRQAGLDRLPEPEIYYPVAQNVTMISEIGMSLIIRTTGRPEPYTDAVRSAVRGVNAHLAIFNVKTMDQVLSDSLWELHLYLWLIGLFAALTLALTAIGLYGVISYNATARMREFAVRLALGSEPAQVARLVLRRGVQLAVAGLAAGVLAALALSPLVRHLPVGIRTGPSTYGAVALLLLTIAFVACAVPAIRVARLNPATALRHD